MSLSVRRRLHGLAASVIAAAAACGAVSAPAAQASLISTGACDSSALSQPFLPWSDASYYKLVPGGDFEGSTAGWSLSGGAGVVAGSEPAGATGSVGASSLSLPAGSSAQSPSTCVNAAYPDLRFFAATGSPGSVLAVSVVYQSLLGQMAIPVGVVTLSGSWSPTLPMLTASAVPGLLSGGTASVSLRFTQVLGSSQIDDVFVDPHGMH